VYEVGYAITIKIYNATSNMYEDGCSIASVAVATRRAGGIEVAYTATVAPAQKAAASTAAKQVESDPSILVSSISAAKTSVAATATAEEKAELANITVPTAASIQVKPATITTPAPPPPPGVPPPPTPPSKSSSEGGGMLMILIIGGVGAAVVAVVIVVAFFMCKGAKEEDVVKAKLTGKGGKVPSNVDMEMAVGVKPNKLETKE